MLSFSLIVTGYEVYLAPFCHNIDSIQTLRKIGNCSDEF